MVRQLCRVLKGFNKFTLGLQGNGRICSSRLLQCFGCKEPCQSLDVLFRPSEGLRELKPSGCERSWPMPLPSPKFPWLFLSHTRSFLPCSPSQFSHLLFTCILPTDTLTFFCLSQFLYVRPHSHAITHLPRSHTRSHQESFFAKECIVDPSTWDPPEMRAHGFLETQL